MKRQGIILGSNEGHYRWFLKWVGTWSPREKMLRVCRFVYRGGPRGSLPGQPGGGYTAKLSLALRPSLFSFKRSRHEWEATLLGVRIHHQKSFGGWCV
jgi:hypothetical protein